MAKPTLNRDINLYGLIAYYFSTVVGVGAFIIPQETVKIAGPAAIFAWVMMLLFSFPMATIFAHISQRYKESGSILLFLEDAGGSKFGKSMALYLVLSAVFGNMLLAYTASGYLLQILEIEASYLTPIISCGLLGCSCLFNLIKVEQSSKIQAFSVLVICLVVLGIIASAAPYIDIANFTPLAPHGYSSLIGAMIICSYAFTGWENVDSLAGEVKDPNVSYRKAMKIALFLIGTFYLLLVTTVILIFSEERLNSNIPLVSSILQITTNEAVSKAGGVIVFIVLMLGANSWIMGTSRILYALSRDKVLPNFISYISGSSGIPVMGVLVQLIIYSIIAMIMIVSNMDNSTIITITALNYLLLYTVIFLCGARLFTTKRLRWLSSIACIVTIFLLLADVNSLISISLLSVVMCFFYVYFPRRKYIE